MNKRTVNHVKAALVYGAMITAGFSVAEAQEAAQTSTTITTSAGTVSDFTPTAFTIRSGTAPVSYSYTKTTTYVDENGNPVSVETVRSGVPVTVFYTQDGERMVASKVVVHRAIPAGGTTVVKKTTTTTTTTPAP